MTRTLLSRSKGQRSTSPDRFTHRGLYASGSCSGERGNVLGVGNYCYVAVCSPALRRPQREERGGGILWRPPARLQVVITDSLAVGNRTRIEGEAEAHVRRHALVEFVEVQLALICVELALHATITYTTITGHDTLYLTFYRVTSDVSLSFLTTSQMLEYFGDKSTIYHILKMTYQANLMSARRVSSLSETVHLPLLGQSSGTVSLMTLHRPHRCQYSERN